MPKKEEEAAAEQAPVEASDDMERQRDAALRRVKMLEEREASLMHEVSALNDAIKRMEGQLSEASNRFGVATRTGEAAREAEAEKPDIVPGVPFGTVLPPGITVMNGRLIDPNGKFVDAEGKPLKKAQEQE